MTNSSNTSYTNIWSKCSFVNTKHAFDRVKDKVRFTFVESIVQQSDDDEDDFLDNAYADINKNKHIIIMTNYKNKMYDVFSEIIKIERTDSKIILSLAVPDIDYAIKNGLAFESIKDRSIH